jgi:hypothetical protein
VQELEQVRQLLEESEYKKNEKTEQISCHKEYFVKAKTDCSRYQNPVHSFTKSWEDTFCMRLAKGISAALVVSAALSCATPAVCAALS